MTKKIPRKKMLVRERRTAQSSAVRVARDMIADLHEIELVDNVTMRRFDDRCLTPLVKVTAKEVRLIRRETGASQGVFAKHLNVTPTMVSAWERGDRKPTGAARKLLSIVKKKGLAAIA